MGTTGSLAAGQVHNEVRHDLLESDAKALAKTIKMQLIWPLVGFNFGWDKKHTGLNLTYIIISVKWYMEESIEMVLLLALNKLLPLTHMLLNLKILAVGRLAICYRCMQEVK